MSSASADAVFNQPVAPTIYRSKPGLGTLKSVGDITYVPATIAAHYVALGMRMALSNPKLVAEMIHSTTAKKLNHQIQLLLDEI